MFALAGPCLEYFDSANISEYCPLDKTSSVENGTHRLVVTLGSI